MIDVKEPTAEQCSANEKVCENERTVGYAIWYPQMGGYVGKAVALLDKQWWEHPNGCRMGGCFDVLVWHDGEFPFDREGGTQPYRLHHCKPEQFIDFGTRISEWNERGRREA